MAHAADYFTKEQQQKIKSAVAAAEKKTSGEIRVCIDSKIKHEALERAVFWFGKLKMHQTEERNGVLIFIAVEDRKFAVIGDSGIHEKVSQKFWDELVEKMKSFFSSNDLTGGLTHAIEHCGDALAKYFPHQRDDKNELSDEMTFGN
jgi:uncharacterized membrane protein